MCYILLSIRSSGILFQRYNTQIITLGSISVYMHVSVDVNSPFTEERSPSDIFLDTIL